MYFQDSANPQIEGLAELHDNIMFYLVITLSVIPVVSILVKALKNYFYPVVSVSAVPALEGLRQLARGELDKKADSKPQEQDNKRKPANIV